MCSVYTAEQERTYNFSYTVSYFANGKGFFFIIVFFFLLR